MLAATLWRHSRNRALHDFQKRLLHALTRHITRDGRIVGLAGNLVDLIDIDDAALRTLDIVVSGLKQLQDDVFNVFPDITGFGQCRGICHGERHVENTSKRLRQKRLAAACRTDQQDIGLGKLNPVCFPGVGQTLVMVMNSNRENALGVNLTDYVIVKHIADLLRRGDPFARPDH